MLSSAPFCPLSLRQQGLDIDLTEDEKKVLGCVRLYPGLVISTSRRCAYLRSLVVCVSTLTRAQISRAVNHLVDYRLIKCHKPEFADLGDPTRWYDWDYRFPTFKPPGGARPLHPVKQYLDPAQKTWTQAKRERPQDAETDESLMERLLLESFLAAKREKDLPFPTRRTREVKHLLASSESPGNRSETQKKLELRVQEVLMQLEPDELMFKVDIQEQANFSDSELIRCLRSLRRLGVLVQSWMPPRQSKLGYRLVASGEKALEKGNRVIYLPSTPSEQFGAISDFKPHPRIGLMCPVVSLDTGTRMFASADVLFKVLP